MERRRARRDDNKTLAEAGWVGHGRTARGQLVGAVIATRNVTAAAVTTLAAVLAPRVAVAAKGETAPAPRCMAVTVGRGAVAAAAVRPVEAGAHLE